MPSAGAKNTTDCPISCNRDFEYLRSLTWSPLTVTATVTAETVLHVVNERDNITRTTTVTNTEADLANHTQVGDVNSGGTRTATVVLSTSNIVTTHTVTFPTNFFADYPSSYTFCGTLPTTISGVSTCIKYPCAPFKTDNPTAYITYSPFDSKAPVFAYPSHPSVLQTSTVRTSIAPDYKGLTYEAVWGTIDDYQRVYDLFPGLGVLGCRRGDENAPASTKNVALYLTATSTSTESHAAATSTRPQATFKPTSLGSISEAGTVAQTSSDLDSPSSAVTRAGTILSSAAHADATGATEDPNIADASASEQGLPQSVPTPSALVKSIDIPWTEAAPKPTESMLSSNNLDRPTIPSTADSSEPMLVSTGAQGSPAGSASDNPHTPMPSLEPVVIGDQTISANAKSQVILSGQTLFPGSPITLGSGPAATQIQLHTSGGQTLLEAGSSIFTLPANPTKPPALPALSLGSQVITPNSENHYVIESQTLVPGSPVTLSSGSAATPVMLQTTNSHTVLIVGSSTSTLAAAAAAAAVTTAVAAAGHPQPFTIGSQVITANSRNQYVVGSQTLAPGSRITIGSGGVATPILLQTTNGDTLLIVGSSTSTLAPGAAAVPTNGPQPLTIGSQVITANSESQYIIGSQTLTPGGEISVSGTPVSLAPSASEAVIGSSTEGLGGYIMSGLGAGPSASSTVGHNQDGTSSASPAAKTGAASAQWQCQSGWVTAVWILGIVTLVRALTGS